MSHSVCKGLFQLMTICFFLLGMNACSEDAHLVSSNDHFFPSKDNSSSDDSCDSGCGLKTGITKNDIDETLSHSTGVDDISNIYFPTCNDVDIPPGTKVIFFVDDGCAHSLERTN